MVALLGLSCRLTIFFAVRVKALERRFQQAFKALLNPIHFVAEMKSGPDHGPDGGVHARCIPTAGQHRKSAFRHASTLAETAVPSRTNVAQV